MKMAKGLEALESKSMPTKRRTIHLITKAKGQTNAEAIAVSGFNPDDAFIMLVGMITMDIEPSIS